MQKILVHILIDMVLLILMSMILMKYEINILIKEQILYSFLRVILVHLHGI